MNTTFVASAFLAIYFTFFKRIKIYHIALILYLGYTFGGGGKFDELHMWLVDNHLHPISYFKESLNPQITKTLFVLIAYLGLLISYIKRSSWSFDKIFYTIIITIMLMTAFIFHQVTTKILVQQDKALLVNVMRLAVKNNPPNLPLLNNLGVNIFSKEVGLPASDIKVLNSKIGKFPESSLPLLNEIEFNLKHDDSMYTNLFFNNEVDYGNYILLARKKDNVVYYYFMTEQINTLLTRDEIWFFLLCLIAHTVWFFGGILLWAIHGYMFNKRRNSGNKKSS